MVDCLCFGRSGSTAAHPANTAQCIFLRLAASGEEMSALYNIALQ